MKLYKALLKILDKWGCHHKWNVWRTIDYYDISYGRTKNPTYHVFHLKCTKCGKLTKVKSS